MDDLRFARPRTQWTGFSLAPHLFDSFQTHRPGTEVLGVLFEQNFTHVHEPKSKPCHAINLELVLSENEAMHGGAFRMVIPVPDVCGECGGTGRTGFYECDACEGMGVRIRPRSVDVAIPEGARDGTVVPVSLAGFGVRNLYLNVHVRTAGAGVQ